MNIYIVRHGETYWNAQGRLQGQTDTELNEKGIELAQITSEGMKDIDFDFIFSSPLKRALKTAEIIRGSRDIEVTCDSRLMEVCFGVEEGIVNDKRGPEIGLFFTAPDKYIPVEGAESFESLIERARSFIDEVLYPIFNIKNDANVLIVGHGAINKALMLNMKGIELKDFWIGPWQRNCAVNVFRYDGRYLSSIEEGKVYYPIEKPDPLHS